MKRLILFLLLEISPCLQAVNNFRLPGIRCLGMGECGVTQSFLFNPAVINRLDDKSIDINYFNRYGLKELGTVGMALAYPNKLLSLGVDISSFGYDQYRESRFRLSFGKQLNKRWSLGLGIHYSMLQTALTDRQPQYLSTDIGILFSPVEKLLIGMLIMDYPSVPIKKAEIDIEDFTGYSLQIGFQWEVINSMLIVAHVETNKRTVLTGSAGVEYRLYNHFYVRAGVKATPLFPTFGVGYNFLCFTADVAALYHPVLGISTGIGLKYSF